MIYNYKLCQSSITRADCIVNLEVFLDSKLYSHNSVNLHIFSMCYVAGFRSQHNFHLLIP
jgi:hypothetical protein